MAVILGFLSEGANIFIIQNILKADVQYIFKDPVQKVFYGIPSLVILGCITGCYYYTLFKRKELKDVTDRKSS